MICCLSAQRKELREGSPETQANKRNDPPTSQEKTLSTQVETRFQIKEKSQSKIENRWLIEISQSLRK